MILLGEGKIINDAGRELDDSWRQERVRCLIAPGEGKMIDGARRG